MKRTVIALALLGVSITATAGWIFIKDAGERTVHADPDMIRRTGNMARMWELHNFKSERFEADIRYRSTKAHVEYDCGDKRVRTLHLRYYAGQMGSGLVVDTINDNRSEWRPVAPSSIDETLWQLACANR